MSDKCEFIESLLPEYVDNVLDSRTRSLVENHLAQCAGCRHSLELQRTWLQRRSALQTQQAEQIVALDLDSRIMAAIRTEAAQAQPVIVQQRLPFYRQQYFWHRLAGSAAIVVLLIVALQIFQGMNRQTANPAADLTAAITSARTIGKNAQQDSSLDSKSAGAENYAASAATDWQIYNGSLSDLPAAGCLFGKQPPVQPDSTAANPAETKSVPGSENGSAATETQTAAVDTVDVGKTVAYDILSQAASLRILIRPGPSSQTLILAAYPDNVVIERTEMLKKALGSCETAISIAIIRTDELQAVFSKLDKTLYDKVFDQPAAESSWIYILIGE